MSSEFSHIKGRGAQVNPTHRYAKTNYDAREIAEEEGKIIETKYLEVFPKKIVNVVNSPDIPLAYSMNPYEGCEHGCTYCYARNTHPYWGYSAGLDFERVILVKKNAPELLRAELSKKSWKPDSIMLSGNTDCYQPIERQLEITRKILKVLLEFKNPVGVITKNSMIQRDIDILSEMAKLQLATAVISITTANESLRRKMEPRTSTYKKRLETVEALSKHGIPVLVNIAPIIPGLNDIEILKIAKAASEAGALGISHNILRLPGEVEAIFTNWLEQHFPDRKDKVLNQVRSVHGGQIQDTRFGRRMRGEGTIAESVKQQMQIAKKKYFSGRLVPPVRTDLFVNDHNRQQRLF
jgi:DNA repair photolyase